MADDKKPKHKAVNVSYGLWLKISLVVACRGVTTAEYLDPMLAEMVEADWAAEQAKLQRFVPPPPPPAPPQPAAPKPARRRARRQAAGE